MSQLELLINQYPGDTAWENFYHVFKDDWNCLDNKDEYLHVISDEKIAAVIAVKMGNRGLSWFSSTIPALDGKTPAQVFYSSPNGKLAIKNLIMRMP